MDRFPAPPPLDYQAPPQAQGAGSFVTLWAIHCIPWFALFALVIGISLFVIPKFEAIFMDFSTELPMLTRVELGVARWIRNDGGWAMAWMVPVAMGAFSAAIAYRRGRRRGLAAWLPSYGFYLVILGILAVTIIGLFLPMVSLVSAVSGRGK